MSDVQRPLPKDDPRIVAWKAYQASDSFANTRNWALHDAHVDGSLWAAFVAGFEAAHPTTADHGGKVDVVSEVVNYWQHPEERAIAYQAASEVLTLVAHPTTAEVDVGESEEVEQIISAWAFAHNIDGAARNDLFKRLRQHSAGGMDNE